MKITMGWAVIGLLGYIAWLLYNLVETKKIVEVETTERERQEAGHDGKSSSASAANKKPIRFVATG